LWRPVVSKLEAWTVTGWIPVAAEAAPAVRVEPPMPRPVTSRVVPNN
jgi:hypothetical protein